MKKLRGVLIACSLIFGLSVYANSINSASTCTASINEKFQIHLDCPGVSQVEFILDLNWVNFKDAETKFRFCNGISNNLIHFFPEGTGSSVKMVLQKMNVNGGNWTASDWNNHLAKNADRYLASLQSINK